MNAFSRSRIVLPLASLMTVFALAAQAEEPNQQHKGPPPGAGRPPVQAARPSNPHPTGPAGPAAAHVSPGGPAAAHVPPGGPGGHARVVHGGPMPSRSFGGHPYRGHLAWEGGHWRHEMHNGRMGYWWDVGGAWYFYPQPMEGPPAYISDDYADDVGYGDVGPAACRHRWCHRRDCRRHRGVTSGLLDGGRQLLLPLSQRAVRAGRSALVLLSWIHD